MKILISSDINEYQLSGATHSVYALTEELRRLGHEVKLLLLSTDGKSHRDGDSYYIASLPIPVYPTARFSLKTHDKLIKELIEWRPDIVHVQSEFTSRFLANAVIKALNIPYVITCHALYQDYTKYFCPSKKLAKKIIKWQSHVCYDNSKTLIVPSKKLKIVEESYGIKCPIRIIPTGINLKKYQKKLSKKEKMKLLSDLGLPDSNKYMVTISRLAYEKNIDEILKYMPALLKKDKDIKFIIVGDGPYRNKLEKMVKKLGLQNNVIFTGAVPFDDVYKYYQLGNVFVCASTSETQGLTYVEALASGMPMVCKKDPCLEGVLTNGRNGYIFENENEFVNGILKIIGDKALASKMGKFSFERSNNFGLKEFGKEVEKVYKKVLGV